MTKSTNDARRWQYVRDVIWKHVKRGDLPADLFEYFYQHEDIKYPTPDALDRAIDYLIKLEPAE